MTKAVGEKRKEAGLLIVPDRSKNVLSVKESKTKLAKHFSENPESLYCSVGPAQLIFSFIRMPFDRFVGLLRFVYLM